LEFAVALAPAGFDRRRDGVCIHRAGLLLYVCPALTDVLGVVSPESFVGGDVVELFAAGERPRVAAALLSGGHRGPGAPIRLLLQPSNVRATAVEVTAFRVGSATPPVDVLYVRRAGTPDRENEMFMPMREGDRKQPEPGRPTVLICDDEARLGALTAGLLSEYGFNPITVGTGEEALTALTGQGPSVDVVLLDVNLSAGSSARDVLLAMRQRGADARVILTSGLAEEDVDADLVTHPSVVGYIAKPYGVDQLIQTIQKALGRPRV
jgi:CheY-like chemotaxis protein